MSNLTKQLTATEVDAIILRIRTSATLLRHDLLALYDGNAHRAKGSASFEEFCRTYLEISLDATHIRHMRQWARAERELAPTADEPVVLTKSQYLALSPFEDDMRSVVYREYRQALATGNVRQTGLLENIAARRLKALPAAPGATAVAAVPAPAPAIPAPSPAAPAPDPAPGDPWADEEEEDETDQEPIVAVYVSTTTTNRADRRKITCRLPDGYMVEVIVPVRDLR